MHLDLCGLDLGIHRCSDRAQPFAPQAILAAQLRGKREVLDPALGFRDCFVHVGFFQVSVEAQSEQNARLLQVAVGCCGV